jgi:hypothetical protein
MIAQERLVDKMERMSRRLSPDAEGVCRSRPVPTAQEAGELLVESADGIGVPIRHASDTRPIQDHQHRSGQQPDRKRMATVGAVYSVGSMNKFEFAGKDFAGTAP